MKKRIIKCVLAAVTTSLLVTGCSIGGKDIRITTGLSESELFKIDGSAFSVSEAMIYLVTEKNLYEQAYGSDIWERNISDTNFEEYVKNNVKNKLAEIKTLNLLAKEEKIKLSNDEKAKAKEYADKYFKGLTEQEKEYMGIDADTVYDAYKEYLLAEKVYVELVKDVNPEISDADAKVIKVAAIYAKTYTIDASGERIEYTGEEREYSKANIEELLVQIQNGGDFMTIAANNTDADQVEYQFGKGEMIQEFEDVSYSLKSGETSGIVETADGYYIIKCISDYMADETQKNKESMIEDAKKEAFKEIYNPFVEKLSSQFNDDVWNEIKFSDMSEIKTSNFYECMNENDE